MATPTPPPRTPPRRLGLDRVPPTKPAGNREVAAAVADALRQAGKAGQLRHYNIDVLVKDGTAELSGTVASHAAARGSPEAGPGRHRREPGRR